MEERSDGSVPRGPIPAALCDAFKNNGITVAVIEVKYLDATGEYYFDHAVKPVYSRLSPALAACASPGYYVQASDSDTASLAGAFARAADFLRAKPALTQ